jgi:GNAT superfamily N-acetyltransferase
MNSRQKNDPESGHIQILFDGHPETIRDILSLQKKNLYKYISAEESKDQGFVYVEHQPATLQAMADACAPVVARAGNELAGYTLCMKKEFGSEVPELRHFFTLLDQLELNGKSLASINYIVCGQTCVAKEFRGQGLMHKMYQKMAELKDQFAICVTKISEANTRSLHVHQTLGFQIIYTYTNQIHETWHVVAWDWSK